MYKKWSFRANKIRYFFALKTLTKESQWRFMIQRAYNIVILM
jgi:hypothetical protein